MAILVEFRKRWVPLFKTAIASGADIAGDYYFWIKVKEEADNGAENLDVYKLPLFVFFIISCIFGGLTIITLLSKGCGCGPQNKTKGGGTKNCSIYGCLTFACCVTRLNQILSLEILLEDIPQFILTALITYEKGLMTPAAAFNVTTSGFNFVFNIFDMMTPDPDDQNDDNDGDDDDGKMPDGNNVEAEA